MKIHYTKPSITDLEVKYATDAAQNGWGEKCYDYINKFESLFKNHLNIDYAIATSSCTGALHLGLRALDIKAGDEVILADINWIASAAPITYLGAKPVFVDILEDTWCIDPSKIEKAITPKTKAIIAVHLYGNLCEMDKIIAIAKKYNLYIIEDAAEAIGSIYKGKRAGTIGDFGVFSFHGTKTITTGEGGMFVTNNSQLFDKVNILNTHGRNYNNPKQFWAETIGYKYKMSNIQAAIGCAQIERIDELIDKKRLIFSWYKGLFKSLSENIKLNTEAEDCFNSYWMPTLIINKLDETKKNLLINNLTKKNIQVRTFFYPISSLDMFENANNVTSNELSPRGINLPSYHDMKFEDVEFVFRNVFKELKNIGIL